MTGNAFKEVLGEKFDSFSGKAYDISAKYKSDIINVYSGDDTLFSIVMYGSDILAVFADSSDPLDILPITKGRMAEDDQRLIMEKL